MIFLIFKICIFLLLTILSGHFLIDSTSKIAKIFHISPYIIAVTILSIGTSLPEIASSLQAIAVTKKIDLAIGNIVGSNIFNINISFALILLFLREKIIINKIDQIFLALSLGFLVLILFANLYHWSIGIVFLIILLIYYILTIKKESTPQSLLSKDSSNNGLILFLAILAISIIGILYSSELFVQNAVQLAKLLKVSDYIIGITVVAIGTSLPELITTIMAIYKKQPQIALGNLVGSNIVNILGILGLNLPFATWIGEMSFENIYHVLDLIILLCSTLMLILSSYFSQRFYRFSGVFLLSLYVVYLVYIC